MDTEINVEAYIQSNEAADTLKQDAVELQVDQLSDHIYQTQDDIDQAKGVVLSEADLEFAIPEVPTQEEYEQVVESFYKQYKRERNRIYQRKKRAQRSLAKRKRESDTTAYHTAFMVTDLSVVRHEDKINLIFDCGCTAHMWNHRSHFTTNPLSQFASTTSAQLAGVLSDETGTGVAVFNNKPTFLGTIQTTPCVALTANPNVSRVLY